MTDAKPDHYDPLPDTAQLFAAVMHTAVTGAALDVKPLMRIATRLGIDHGTGAPAIEAKLRGIIQFRVRRDWADEASVYLAGAEKATEYRAATGNISSGLDLILQAMADRCGQLARERAAEEAPE